MRLDEVGKLNQDGWDRRVAEKDVWTQPVSPDEIARARLGDWSIVLTPNKPVPRDWFGDVAGSDVLCLASGGGQQGPILSAAGARVTVFDASPRQLAQDEKVARRERLSLVTRQGFMHDLSAFDDAAFDLIFSDINMPIMDGLEFIEQRKQEGLAPGVPVVMITTEGSTPMVMRALAAGARGYICKPFTTDQVKACVMPLLGAA